MFMQSNAVFFLQKILHDTYHPPLDKIRPISPTNPKRQIYIEVSPKISGRQLMKRNTSDIPKGLSFLFRFVKEVTLKG